MSDDRTDASTESVFRLIYRSRLTASPDDYRADVEDILKVARRKNPALGVTGALVIWDDSVVQTLEGEEETVRGLYDTIGRDPRHAQVEVVETSPGVERTFARWSMAQVSDFDNADFPLRMSQWEGGIDVYGYRALTSPEQDVLIQKMRERIRGASA